LTNIAPCGHCLDMRRFGAMALLGLAFGCGRSDLTDELLVSIGPDDAGTVGDDADSGQPVDSSMIVPPDDVSVAPPEDVTIPEDVALPEDVVAPEDVSTEDVFTPPGGCGYTTCSGCCDSNGGCHQGSDTSACGGQGEQCSTCNQICVDGICLNLASNCGPSNCTGCCLGNDVCTDGLHAGACGSGGMQCESCNPATGGGKCLAKTSEPGGACQFPTSDTCNASICPMGCCVGALCVQGTQDIACGSGGIACQDCTQNGRTCLGRTCSF
jgi:hypothetical protein